MYQEKPKICYTAGERGFVTLVSVLVVGAVGVAITMSIILLGVGTSRTGFAYQQTHQAMALANACGEEGLEQIRESETFVGTDTLVLGQGSCSYEVTSQGGENRIITVQGTVGDVVRKAKIVIDAIHPSIHVVSWSEVADF